MVKNIGKKRPLDKVREIELQGELQNIEPIIFNVIAEGHYKNCDFDLRVVNSKSTSSFALYDVFIIDRTFATPHKTPIGAFTLQLIGNNRLVFRVPPSSQWTWGHLSPLEKIEMGLHEAKYKEHFIYLIKEIDTQIKRYRLKAAWYKKVWVELKDSLLTFLAKFAAEKTKGA
jgi:hypothetical protein